MADNPSFLARRQRELLAGNRAVPLEFDDLEREARDALPDDVFGYASAVAGEGETAGGNREAFRRHRIVTRVLRDVAERDLSIDLFGRTLAAPLLLAPVGSQQVYDEEGELATARAAADLGVPIVLSASSSFDLEAVADAAGGAPKLFQVYWRRDWEVTESQVTRAERAGYDAVVLTVDSQVPTWRRRTLTDADLTSHDSTPGSILSDPVFREKYADEDADDEDLKRIIRDDPAFGKEVSLTWDALDTLAEWTDLPVVVKGILHPDDAREAVDRGASGVVVSNHGGRQIDGELASVDALPAVLDAVDGRAPVLLDSGVRSGSDVFVALALGASGVLLSRPYVYGLAVAGERGVYEATANVLAELESVLGLTGHTSIADVDRSALVSERPPASF